MSVFKLSNRSLERLVGVDDQTKDAVILAINEITVVDFGIPPHGGFRTAEEQFYLYKKGASERDGYEKESYHQSGKAIDFYAYVDGKASWEYHHLAMVAAAILQAGTKIGIELEWGGFWEPRKPRIINGVNYGWDCGHIQRVR